MAGGSDSQHRRVGGGGDPVERGAEGALSNDVVSPGSARAPSSRRTGVATGDLLGGRYQLRTTLGAGSMGTVYAARDHVLDVDVAVKVVRADLLEDDDGPVAERLLQEARAAACIGHPGIAQVLSAGLCADGSPYLAMELLVGESLGAVLARVGRLSAPKALATLLPIAHALAAAHDKGIVHRDLKPENVFIARASDGGVQPKVIDFGVAKLQRRSCERLTAVGSVIGSPSYFSPEHVYGDDVDAAADLWAFCVMLYQLVAGRLPFEAEELRTLLHAIAHEPHVPLVRHGVADEALSEIVDRGLAKARADRWQSMRCLGTALARWLSEQGVTHDITRRSLHAAWLRDGPPTGIHDLGRPNDRASPAIPRDLGAAALAPVCGSAVGLSTSHNGSNVATLAVGSVAAIDASAHRRARAERMRARRRSAARRTRRILAWSVAVGVLLGLAATLAAWLLSR